MGGDLKTKRSNQAKNKQTSCTQYNQIKKTHYWSNVSFGKVVQSWNATSPLKITKWQTVRGIWKMQMKRLDIESYDLFVMKKINNFLNMWMGTHLRFAFTISHTTFTTIKHILSSKSSSQSSRETTQQIPTN
jgi:hypothetical protein